ncbi:MAG: tryptophan 2,3-dioxygenase [Planctomycetes bacterium]|nr:tryptophan 2,3-dioxygenase [Planctomycetota bacterium]
MEITYGKYLKVQELLSLQQPVGTPVEHDETLFIIIHQVYELWFKQQIHEGERLGRLFAEGRLEEAASTLSRMLKILKTMVAQIDVLETMTPTSFLAFRSFLTNASGFQSWQFRAFEFLLGKRNPKVFDRYAPGSPERVALERHFKQPTLWACFVKCLATLKQPVPESALQRDPTAATVADPQLQELLLRVYKAPGPLRGMCEMMVDLDEGIQEWRYRHVKMVERTIGTKTGTGGSSGVEYLRSTLFQPLFPDLWEIRSLL